MFIEHSIVQNEEQKKLESEEKMDKELRKIKLRKFLTILKKNPYFFLGLPENEKELKDIKDELKRKKRQYGYGILTLFLAEFISVNNSEKKDFKRLVTHLITDRDDPELPNEAKIQSDKLVSLVLGHKYIFPQAPLSLQAILKKRSLAAIEEYRRQVGRSLCAIRVLFTLSLVFTVSTGLLCATTVGGTVAVGILVFFVSFCPSNECLLDDSDNKGSLWDLVKSNSTKSAVIGIVALAATAAILYFAWPLVVAALPLSGAGLTAISITSFITAGLTTLGITILFLGKISPQLVNSRSTTDSVYAGSNTTPNLTSSEHPHKKSSNEAGPEDRGNRGSFAKVIVRVSPVYGHNDTNLNNNTTETSETEYPLNASA